jgi:hypothetical protein
VQKLRIACLDGEPSSMWLYLGILLNISDVHITDASVNCEHGLMLVAEWNRTIVGHAACLERDKKCLTQFGIIRRW